MHPSDSNAQVRWFVMRDLKRANAKLPAWQLLHARQIRVFTPMVWRLYMVRGKKERRQAPFLSDLLFVQESRERLDPIVGQIPTLQYRWLRQTWREPMTVSDAEMERFIRAVSVSATPKYYLPEEVTPSMCGRRIRIVGGPLDGYEGTLVTTRGSAVKRLLIQLPNLLAVTVEVAPEYIQVL